MYCMVHSTKVLVRCIEEVIPHICPDHGRTEKPGKRRESSGVTFYGVLDDWIRLCETRWDGVEMCGWPHHYNRFLHQTVDELCGRRLPALIRADVASTQLATVANQRRQLWSFCVVAIEAVEYYLPWGAGTRKG